MFRACFDGSAMKELELFKKPCKLDTCRQTFAFLKKGMLLTKIDDKCGFHHLRLDQFSKNMACCEYGGELFRYNGAPFGIPKVPGAYQTVNSVPVSYLRAHGFHCFIYLDDRLYLTMPKSKAEEQAMISSDVVPEAPFLGMLQTTAAGTFINRPKSVLQPSQKMEFLGFGINTQKTTIKIPNEKFEVFQKQAADIRKRKTCTYKELEKIRGKMTSFALVAENMR